jgi:hypothetical protein
MLGLGIGVTRVLFRSAELEGIRSGDITLAFRRWKRPTVKAGGSLRIPAGVLAIDAVDVVDPSAITDADARRAGRASRTSLIAELEKRAELTLYRVRFRLTGGDERVALREQTNLSADEMDTVLAALARLDRHGGHGAWTRKVLDAIASAPATLAADLAASLGFEKMWFKTHVRKLKALGLTESLEVGYRLSPRGREVLSRMEK